MKTKKTRQELERKNNNILGWIIIGLVCLFVFWMIMDEAQINRLKTQLSECQEQVPVWTLKIKCNFHNVTTYSVEDSEYNSYDEWKLALDKFELDREYFIKKDWKTCEVISND